MVNPDDSNTDTMIGLVDFDDPDDLRQIIASMRREILVLKTYQTDNEPYMKWVRKVFNKASAMVNGAGLFLFGLWQSGALDWLDKIKIVE